MAEDSSNTKPGLCSLDEADWVSATELGENITQLNYGAWVLACGPIQEALAGGCGAVLELEQNGQKSYSIPPPGFWFPPDRLRWVNALNPSMRREDYPDRSWPWELRAYLLSSEREGFDATARIFLRRTEAAQWGLPLESPQAVASEESPPPRAQPGKSTVGSTGAPAPAPIADAPTPVQSVPEVQSKPLPDKRSDEPTQQSRHMSRKEQSQWLKTTLGKNPPGEDEPITPEGYGKRIADMGIPIGAMYEPSSVVTRYYVLNPGAQRRRKPQK